MTMGDYKQMDDAPAGPLPPPFALSKLDSDKESLLKGLTDAEVAEMVKKYGLNEVPEEKEPLWKMFLKQFTGPMQIMIEGAALLCFLIHNWPDFTIIMVLLITNGTLGFFEEKSAQASVDALKAGLEKKMPVKRNGKFDSIPVVQVVPGDVLFMRGGDIVPADCYWMEGDPCQVDEAALTGESLPVKVPRKDDEGKPASGRQMWSGSILKVGECQAVVSHTGMNTMIGEAAKAIQEASGKDIGVFEGKILEAAQVLILITIVVVSFLFYFMYFVQHVEITEVLEMSLSLVIASVPVALPMVMKVTLSIGAKEMSDEGGIVTHLTALEEIASMKVLCSDKTGTLTTAQMTVYYDETAKAYNGFSAEQVLEFASLASNEANKDDPIDSAVLRAYAKSKNFTSVDDAVDKRKQNYSLDPEGFMGFNPIVKRTCAAVTAKDGTKYFCSKGMVDVILKTNADDEGKQWTVDNYAEMSKTATKADADLGISGFKTLGVAVSKNGGPMLFAGILPIMDPPRHDTKETIRKIKQAQVAVKMITGDHHNIGKELARQIDLGMDIRTPDCLQPPSEARDLIVMKCDGFAKVKPLDKHEVVQVLQDKGLVVGMTGDGVNDAPALAKAQIGIAVHGATDAAKSAGDIVLTKDGLSPIYTAIQISRRIFKRLKSYVIYRICITVQVVFFLAALAIFYNLRFKALYIILLALFHDLQIVTIAYDHQVAGAKPETPTVLGLLLQSYSMGILMFVQTMLLVSYGHLFLSDSYGDGYFQSMDSDAAGSEMNKYMETTLFLQISNSSAILIFSARTVGFFFTTMPAWQLTFSTALGQVLINIWCLVAPTGLVDKLLPSDVAKVWLYDIAWLLFLDLVKMTAGRLWEKYKPATIDRNPALQAHDRNSRRMSNNLRPSYMLAQAGREELGAKVAALPEGTAMFTDRLLVLKRLHDAKVGSWGLRATLAFCAQRADWAIQSVSDLLEVIAACRKLSDWSLALWFFNRQKAKLPEVVAANACISACADCSVWRQSLSLLSGVRCAQIKPDVVTYNIAVEATRSWLRAGQLLQECRSFVQCDVITFNSLLGGEGGLQPDLLTANLCLSSCEQSSNWPLSMHALRESRQMGLQPNAVSFNTVRSAGAGSSAWTLALNIQGDADAFFYGVVTSACAAAAAWRFALRGLAGAKAAADTGRLPQALQLLYSHRTDDGDISAETFNAGLAKGPWTWSQELLRAMRRRRVALDASGQSCVLRSAGRAAGWAQALVLKGGLARQVWSAQSWACEAALAPGFGL
ncbi:unnamed protein product [Effrenium voratum]|nr:unnamed protein product [Effrenium voratum]